MLLLLACQTPEPDPPDEPGPGAWDDPIVRGASLDLGVDGPELTDAALAGDQLLLFGQEKSSQGGIWTYSLGDPGSPALLGHTERHHLQRGCWDGTGAWGITRDGQVVAVTLGEEGPEERGAWQVTGVGTGIDCDAERVVWGGGLASGGWALQDGDGLGDPHLFETEVQDVRLEGDRLWVLAYDRLTAWDFDGDTLSEGASVPLDGTCQDLAGGDEWLAVACGSGGVTLVDRAGPTVIGTWTGFASARAVAVAGDQVWVAAWSDLLLLDAADATSPRLVGVEAANTSILAVAADADRAYVADWSAPYVATATGASAPEVRASADYVEPGGTVVLTNDGTEALWVEGKPVAIGGSLTLDVPADAVDTVSWATDDPDEPTVTLAIGGPGGLEVGMDAPDFAEADLGGELWELQALHGEVVFLGLFTDG